MKRISPILAAFLLVVSLSSALAASGKKFRDCHDCPEMIVIPAGDFMMGSPASDAERADNEAPQHRVVIARPSAMGVYDVTRAEYAVFVRETGHGSGDGCYVHENGKMNKNPAKDWRDPGFKQTDRDPVMCVNWDDTQAYVQWVNGRLARGKRGMSRSNAGPYRLPTEAEWEYAARAGTTTRYYWGDEASHDKANYGSDTCAPLCGPKSEGRDRWDFTSPVGSFPSNAFGLYDMIGNTAQWVEDCRHDIGEDYAGAPADGTAWHKGDCKVRALRGSGWEVAPRFARVAGRAATLPDLRLDHLGFRVARTID